VFFSADVAGTSGVGAFYGGFGHAFRGGGEAERRRSNVTIFLKKRAAWLPFWGGVHQVSKPVLIAIQKHSVVMKNLILSFCALAFATTLHAQLSGIGFRPTVTLSTYKLSNDLNDNYDVNLRLGGGGAIFAEFNLGSRFTFQPEIVYVQRGGNIKSESSLFWDGQQFGYPRDYRVEEIQQKETLHYIDIPLMFEKNFGGGNVGAYVAFGPALSFAVANGKGMESLTVRHLNSEGQSVTFTDREEYVIEMGKGRNDDYKKNDFSVNLGTGLVFILERGEIGFDVRYSHGMRNIDVGGIKNRGFQVGLSYMYYF